MNEQRIGDWLQTYSGGQFFPLDPRPEEIDIRDIAHSLSLICRFNGHCRSFYSVAEHSIRASFLVPPEDAPYALLHDAVEVYTGDIITPIKNQLLYSAPGDTRQMSFRKREHEILAVVLRRFGLKETLPDSVKKADLIMLATEFRDIMVESENPPPLIEQPLSGKIEPWSPESAEMHFLFKATQYGFTEADDGR